MSTLLSKLIKGLLFGGKNLFTDTFYRQKYQFILPLGVADCCAFFDKQHMSSLVFCVTSKKWDHCG